MWSEQCSLSTHKQYTQLYLHIYQLMHFKVGILHFSTAVVFYALCIFHTIDIENWNK